VSKEKSGDRLTAFDAGGIYRTGNGDFPNLALNEWFCLRVAQRAGIEVPPFELSQDRRVLRLARFDRTPAGPLGFEDFAVLQGLGTAQKYESTYERVVKSAATFVPAGERVRTRREMFRNGDAHLKNFGLLYSSAADVRLGPLYDAVTTTACPMLRNDVPALTLDGRRSWALKKGTWTRFAQAHCALERAAATEIVEALARSVEAESAEAEQYAIRNPEVSELIGAMRAQWRAGVADVRNGL
jgi:serine/threonine-protein kinase HipA